MPDSELNPEPCVEQSQEGILKRDASSKVPQTQQKADSVKSGFKSENDLLELCLYLFSQKSERGLQHFSFVQCLRQSLKRRDGCARLSSASRERIISVTRMWGYRMLLSFSAITVTLLLQRKGFLNSTNLVEKWHVTSTAVLGDGRWGWLL